jgi:type I restriction-modification system DNA methylase subunit
LGRRHGNRVVLDDDTAERIKSSYSEWQDEEGFSQIVSFEGLDPKSFSFSPALYVKQPTRTTKMSPDDQRSRIVELEARYAMLCQEYEAVRSRLARSS